MSQLSLRQNALIRACRRTYKPAACLAALVQLAACSAGTPAQLGAGDGRLAPCPDSPNCVSSQAPEGQWRVEPLPLRGNPRQTQERLVTLLDQEPRARLVEQRDGYLRAEFRSRLLRFIDDVEFLVGEQKVDVRSASRLGHTDFGVNRQRVERLRQGLERQP
ncbi:DUF1499 domain-containing protein [Pseudomonas sp. MBLB4136]|uniref:DUF1499 domain-containing protein n=1 Tax=Pseudomonas sp. MBLB4136 TaxID=3451558 RepID=UPI003F74FE28